MNATWVVPVVLMALWGINAVIRNRQEEREARERKARRAMQNYTPRSRPQDVAAPAAEPVVAEVDTRQLSADEQINAPAPPPPLPVRPRPRPVVRAAPPPPPPFVAPLPLPPLPAAFVSIPALTIPDAAPRTPSDPNAPILGRPQGRPTTPAARRAVAMLRSPQGLAAAIALREIMAPPVALRPRRGA